MKRQPHMLFLVCESDFEREREKKKKHAYSLIFSVDISYRIAFPFLPQF